jgi:hypothetical protein
LKKITEGVYPVAKNNIHGSGSSEPFKRKSTGRVYPAAAMGRGFV